METFDVIVIGGGPNGLTIANYLQKAGLKTLILEKKHEFGGGMYTDDFSTPFRYNLHAIYMMLGDLMPPYKDLELDKYPVQFIKPEEQFAFVRKDGQALVFYSDDEKTLAEIKRVAPGDEPGVRKLLHDFNEMCDHDLIPATYAPPMPALELVMLHEKDPVGRMLSGLSQKTPIEVIDSYGIKDPFVRGALLYLGCKWGIKPDMTGATFMMPVYLRCMTRCSIIKGGTHSLSAALYNVLARNGGKLLDWSEVEKITTEGGRATGVALKDGREFKATKAIVSTLNPQTTFLKLLDKDVVPRELRSTVRQWMWEEWSWYTLHLGIKGGPPAYAAAKSNPDVNKALIVAMGYETEEDVLNHIKMVTSGIVPEPAGVMTCTTLHDPTQAASGPYAEGKYGPLHTLRWEGWAPYNVKDGDWDDLRLPHAKKVIESIREYAPNLQDAKVLFRFADSPKDVSRRLVDMVEGSIKHGAYVTTQMGFLRPNDMCSYYATPVPGLYVGGASTFPGGMVLLGSGYNCATRIVNDLGAKKWWTEPDFLVEAQKKKLVPTWEMCKPFIQY